MPLKPYISELITFATGVGGMKAVDMYLQWKKNKKEMDLDMSNSRSSEYQTLIDLYKSLYQDVKESDEICKAQYTELQIKFGKLESKYEHLNDRFNELLQINQKLNRPEE